MNTTQQTMTEHSKFHETDLDVWNAIIKNNGEFVEMVSDAIILEETNHSARKFLEIFVDGAYVHVLKRLFKDKDTPLAIKSTVLFTLANLLASVNCKVAEDAVQSVNSFIEEVFEALHVDKTQKNAAFVILNLAKFGDDGIFGSQLQSLENDFYNTVSKSALCDILWALLRSHNDEVISFDAIISILEKWRNAPEILSPALQILGKLCESDVPTTVCSRLLEILGNLLRSDTISIMSRQAVYFALSNLIIEPSVARKFFEICGYAEESAVGVPSLITIIREDIQKISHKSHYGVEALWVIVNAVVKMEPGCFGEKSVILYHDMENILEIGENIVNHSIKPDNKIALLLTAIGEADDHIQIYRTRLSSHAVYSYLRNSICNLSYTFSDKDVWEFRRAAFEELCELMAPPAEFLFRNSDIPNKFMADIEILTMIGQILNNNDLSYKQTPVMRAIHDCVCEAVLNCDTYDDVCKHAASLVQAALYRVSQEYSITPVRVFDILEIIFTNVDTTDMPPLVAAIDTAEDMEIDESTNSSTAPWSDDAEEKSAPTSAPWSDDAEEKSASVNPPWSDEVQLFHVSNALELMLGADGAISSRTVYTLVNLLRENHCKTTPIPEDICFTTNDLVTLERLGYTITRGYITINPFLTAISS